MRKISIIVLIAVSAAVLAAVYLWPSRHEGVFYPMGGIPLRVVAYGTTGSGFSKDLDVVQKKVEELEEVFSSHRRSSELRRINNDAHGGPFKISADMKRVLESAVDWWRRTGGAFDVTVGPLIDLWSDAGSSKRLPAGSDIAEALRSVGTDKIEIKDDQIRIKMRDVEIGLGGIAKGDIVDQVAGVLTGRGVRRGVVDAGGDILAFGDGTFRFGIQDPTAKAGERIIGVIEMPAGALVTSGNYERFVEINGKKYSHIIDPRTGMTIDNGLEAATVIADKSIDADALATALMVMGREKAIQFLHNEPIYKGILIEKSGDKYIVWVGSGLEDKVHFEEPWGKLIRTF